MQFKWLHLLVIKQIWTIVLCKSYFTVLAPGTIKSNRIYTASVTLHTADGPAIIRLGISAASNFYMFQDVTLQPFQTKLIGFNLPKLNKDFEYELIAEGIEGLSFKNSTKLLYDDINALKVYVETSKGIYKPGDLVQFRVIILNEHLKPVKLIEPVKIQILDANNHRVKQFKNIPLVKGMFSGNIQLSEQPNLGFWKILVSISGKYDIRDIKKFKVDKYVLPKFSIHMDCVDDFVHEDETFKVTVYGKYTYGRYVEGTVVVKTMVQKHVFETQTKNIEDHKATFELNVSNYLESAEIEPEFEIEATLIDKYTNASMRIKKKIRHHNQRYKIVIPLDEIEFRNNQPYLIKAKVRYLNNTEVNDRTTPIFMKHGTKVYQSLLDDHGAATFIFNYESDQTNEFYFKKTSFHLSNIFYNGQVTEDSLCNLKVKPGKIQLGKIVEVVLSSKSYIPYFVYILTGHGSIIYTEYVQLESAQNSYTIRFKPTIEMVPKTELCIHYIDKSQLSYCDIKIGFPDELENKINISTLHNTVKPGQEVTFNIRAQPQSRIGLLALDLSAHLLNSNYSINLKQIFLKLNQDQSYIPYDNILFGERAGLVTLTNADIINVTPIIKYGIIKKVKPSPRSASTANSANTQSLVRTTFPETWIFKEIDIVNENTTLSLNIPDTITTWLVTAISINEESGFGITDESLKITVFQPFFISTNLPYSIKRGEIISIPLTVFNYYEYNLKCEIIMNNSQSNFRLLDDKNNILNLTQAMKEINVLANSGTNVMFKVQALKLGQLNVSLTATNSSLTLDAIVQPLKVEPEGILINDSQENFLNLQTGSAKTSWFKANIPQDIVSESEYLILSIGGDIMVPSLKNLNKLVQMPTGCGEQNMINFAPNILVLDYLKAIDQWQSYADLVAKAKGFIETGYQRELTYRHDTGGYSVFGPGYEESTWLTAYVIRFFIKAVKYVAVEPEIITSGLDFLANYQQSNGEFEHTGHLFYPAHQNRYGFTAFVLLTFMENRKYRNQYNHVIQRGLGFLSDNIDNINDTYALSIMAMTFQMAQNDKALLIKNKLLTMQQNENNRKWWRSTDKTQSNDVEITAYVLMALLETKETDHISIFRWLIEQRKSNGGFDTTHGTVVGLQALIKFSEQYNTIKDTLINISYTAEDEEGLIVKSGTFDITEDNIMILQSHELPYTTRFIQYEATGSGNCLLQFSYQYYVTENQKKSNNDNINVTLPKTLETFRNSTRPKMMEPRSFSKRLRSLMMLHKPFIIKPTSKMLSINEMLLEVCFQYQPTKDVQFQKTNMIILDICLPSGFVSNKKSIQELLEQEIVTKVELQNSDSKIIVYFDQLQAKDEHCLQVQSDKVHDIDMLKPSTIDMYDYYNENLRNTVFY